MFKNENNIPDLLIDYLSDNLNDEDRISVIQWINESDANKSQFELLARIWNNKTSTGGKKYGWNKLFRQMKSREPKPILQKPNFTKIAAVIMLLIGITGYLTMQNKPNNNAVFATQGNFLTDTLKNGCVLYLYPSSELIQTKNSKTIDEYTLIGEAFFIMPQKMKKSISISMGDAQLKVTETSFRAKSCANNSDISITVESGNAELSNKNKPKEKLQIFAGEQGYYSCNQHNIWKQKNNDNIYLIYQPEINLN